MPSQASSVTQSPDKFSHSIGVPSARAPQESTLSASSKGSSEAFNAPLTPVGSPQISMSRICSADPDEFIETSLGPELRQKPDPFEVATACICPTERKIPRPRNAFILYRQHNQARIVTENPGVTNTVISKIIGDQWRTELPEITAQWKELAEQEKQHHKKQYPGYRYQPKRNKNRHSAIPDSSDFDSRRFTCQKCGRPTVNKPMAPSDTTTMAAEAGSGSNGVMNRAPWPEAVTTSSSRSSSDGVKNSTQAPMDRRSTELGENHDHAERLSIDPLADRKRRRLNDESPIIHRNADYCSRAANLPTIQTTGLFPAHGLQPQSHPVAEAWPAARNHSLDRGNTNPPPLHLMPPPPRPSLGYHDYRANQGFDPLDNSFTLPPLQINRPPPTSNPTELAASARDARDKISILRRVAPPDLLTIKSQRGPLIAFEGDDQRAVESLKLSLKAILDEEESLSVRVLDGPNVSAHGNKASMMARYHQLAAEWLERSDGIIESLASRPDMIRTDVAEGVVRKGKTSPSQLSPGQPAFEQAVSSRVSSHEDSSNTGSADPQTTVCMIANYSLYATNFFSARIPLSEDDPYGPSDHWQWTATQWRGIVGPDLTIYLRNIPPSSNARSGVELADEGYIILVKRQMCEGNESSKEFDPTLLRRLRFEVTEWIRAFSARAGENGRSRKRQ